MKKVLAILAMVVFGCGLAGCGEDEKSILPDEKQHAANGVLLDEWRKLRGQERLEFEKKHPNIKKISKQYEFDNDLLEIYKSAKEAGKKIDLKKWKHILEIIHGEPETKKEIIEYRKQHPEFEKYEKKLLAAMLGIFEDD